MKKKINNALTKFKNLPLSDKLGYIFIYSLLFFLLLITIYPLFYVFFASFIDPISLQIDGINFHKENLTLYGYKTILTNPAIVRGFVNSMVYSFTFGVLQVAICMTFAYPLSQKKLKGKKAINVLMIITMFFGGGLIPTYLLIQQLGMLNTVWALIIPGAFSVWNIILARTFIKGLPSELEEAAKMDGTSHFQYFFKILLPLSKPIMMVIFLYAFVGQWNAYFDAMIYIDDDKLQPLQTVLRQILIQNQLPTDTYSQQMAMAELAKMASSVKYAVIVVSSIPLLVLYPFFQKYFTKGVMLGSVKG